MHRGGKGCTCKRRTRKDTNRNTELARAGPQVQYASMGRRRVRFLCAVAATLASRLWSGVVLLAVG
ncbi:hypothetical protein Cst04h_28990 [Corynebacterium striatum]|uniref:Uncharacterized protein n=1 Tax=Corynebacterium striatum TaxID=43770 RepID=A0ABC9ZR96_CORST|nr:hypothetical protein Cst04h_10070 [Corynebacterium striatum]GEA44729.1 hypothetical protein Cst04h_28990 [Corynebacterium striatum]